ncbi:MAG: agmatine deiminase family protein [Sandaracinaceae bacterium]|nr:agmatine deiminase family protein [Sandaracinaceae bacterium]
MDDTPRALGFSMPAEWEPHESVWLAWPSHDDLWGELLVEAQREHIALCKAIADVHDGLPRGETLNVLVPTAVREMEARSQLGKLGARFHRVPFGDIWMRDIAPIFLRNDDGEIAPVCFAFNGWGGKYVLDGDDLVAGRVGELAGGRLFAYGMVLEGGAIEVDGEGTLLTTRQCLLNRNRNPGMDQASTEAALREALGVETILWLDEGLLNDHTDGHVDTIARFVRPGVVACMQAKDASDPNREVLDKIARSLSAMRDHRGRKLEVVRVPSPGKVEDHEGLILPASYMNWYLANTTVVVPTYRSKHDEAALEAIAPLFPGRRAVGAKARAILTGGGAFHCITQQQPARRSS